ncbi:hypothetical protein CDAR_307721 [Caerostris darwini]|uniref:Uncharacterized protein n=1 Tax=Caerostris darwini TaxID=1538125 RepID=A0AAV4WHH9_9ARAC|nr:hypothetical protein CDAR_307721 [Caerostris darwini]
MRRSFSETFPGEKKELQRFKQNKNKKNQKPQKYPPFGRFGSLVAYSDTENGTGLLFNYTFASPFFSPLYCCQLNLTRFVLPVSILTNAMCLILQIGRICRP